MVSRRGFLGKVWLKAGKVGGVSRPPRPQEGLCPMGREQMRQRFWPGWTFPQGGGNSLHEPHQTGPSGRSQAYRRDRRKLLESQTGMAWWRENRQPGRWFLPRKRWAQLQAPDPHRIITATQLAASPLKAAGGPPPRCPQARPVSHEALQPPTLRSGPQPSSAGCRD